MKQQLLRTRSMNVEGILVATEVYVTKKVLSLKENKGKSLKAGWNNIAIDCKCPEDSSYGYYLCVGGNCVYFPIG